MGAELDLTEELRNYIYPINLKELSLLIQEDQQALSKANELLIPLVLSGLIAKSSQSGGTEMIFLLAIDAVNKQQNDLRNIWVDDGNLLKRSQYNAALLLEGLQTNIYSTINTICQIKFNSLKILTALSTLQALKYLGEIIRKNQLTVHDLYFFLRAKQMKLADKLPTDFAKLLENSNEHRTGVIDESVFWKNLRNGMQKAIAMFF